MEDFYDGKGNPYGSEKPYPSFSGYRRVETYVYDSGSGKSIFVCG